MSARLGLNILLAAAIIATAAGGIVLMFRSADQSDGVVVTMPTPVTTPDSTAADSTIKVYISGQANLPGVYELPADSRADDALRAAGGPTSQADLDSVNLAKRLLDEDQIHIPSREEGRSATAPGSRASSPPGKLLLNTATAEELETLPNIGPSRAKAIIEYRDKNGPFARVDDLTNVSGIGTGILESIRDLVEVR